MDDKKKIDLPEVEEIVLWIWNSATCSTGALVHGKMKTKETAPKCVHT